MMTVPSFSPNAVSTDGIVTIQATAIEPPPAWALVERQLIKLMETSADLFIEKYTHPGGEVYYVQDVDDVYEIFYNWGLFYAMGADKKLFDWAWHAWNATTHLYDDGLVIRADEKFHPNFQLQLHNEYYTLAEWFHQGEGNMAFYDFGVANPTIPENMRRARRFAAMYIGDDPAAPNYDSQYKIIRSPFSGSKGPLFHAGVGFVKSMLDPIYGGQPGEYAQRSTLSPVVVNLEPNWFEHPQRQEEIVKSFDEIVLNGDVPNSLSATALVTNAYLYTGEDKYKQWILEYVDVWMDRMRRNNGIMPDNVGPTGKIGEQRHGQWWGGQYGWNSRWSADIMFIALTVAAECALLLSGDYGYLELIRSQLRLLMDGSITRDDGQLLVPTRYGPNGWEAFQPMRILEWAHLYHASMEAIDHESIVTLKTGDVERDWNHVESDTGRRGGDTEYARFQYYDGQNPNWPEQILRAEYHYALAMLEAMRNDSRDFQTIVADNRWPPVNPEDPSRKNYGGENANPVRTVGLTQIMLGAPRTMYNGGLLRAQVRYFDPDRARPGLPNDVAACVDKLEADRTGIQLVNLSPTKTRHVIVQAGAFGEHQFTELRVQQRVQPIESPAGWMRDKGIQREKVIAVDAKHLAVQLPPSTSIRLEIGTRRFVNRPSYAFPWHGGKVPVPF